MRNGSNSTGITRFFKSWPMAMLVAMLLVSSAAPAALAQSAARVKVLIAFSHQPGPAEEALVRGVGGDIKYTYHLVPAIAALVPEAAIEALRSNPNVTAVDLDIEVHVVDAELDNSWGVKHIGAGVLHASGNKGAGVKVAVLDTGIDTDHPDLNYDPTCSASFVAGESLEDGHSHGTHVAGTLAGLDNDTGVVGAAPEVTLCIYKVLSNSGSGSYSDIIAAVQQAVADGVQVTNNSYGSSGDPGPTVKAAFDNAYAAGVLHVGAAGNYGNPDGTGDTCIYPARWDSVMATAATDQNDARASFSSTCAEVELAAPGYQINSTMPGAGYGYKNGTSMASPHVAGTAALVLAANPGWSNDQVRTQLQTTAGDLGDPGRDAWYGFGLVDADEAAPPPPTPMHVGNLDGTSLNVGKNWQAQVTITVHDASHQAVADATVNGTWSGGWSGSSNCTTDAGGVCAVTSGDIPKKGSSSAIFSVSSVDQAGYTYSAADNHDPEGNSSGTAIQVNKDGTSGDPGAPANQPPVASFTTTCPDLTCSFDASGSTDPDGSIVTYAWDFGDGNSGSGLTTGHTYAAPGTYSVVLSVTDDGGATGSDTQNVTVSDGSGGMSLTANGYKVKGKQVVDLTWSGGSASSFDVYRDGSPIAWGVSGDAYTDNIGVKGGGSYQYQVCEAGSLTNCSNTVQVVF